MKKSFCFLIVLFLLINSRAFSQSGFINDIVINKSDILKVGTSIPASSIGEPVGSVKLYEPKWVDAANETPAYCVVEGSIFPADPNGWPINFRVLLPASWSQRALQAGGAGMNGFITVREGKNPM